MASLKPQIPPQIRHNRHRHLRWWWSSGSADFEHVLHLSLWHGSITPSSSLSIASYSNWKCHFSRINILYRDQSTIIQICSSGNHASVASIPPTVFTIIRDVFPRNPKRLLKYFLYTNSSHRRALHISQTFNLSCNLSYLFVSDQSRIGQPISFIRFASDEDHRDALIEIMKPFRIILCMISHYDYHSFKGMNILEWGSFWVTTDRRRQTWEGLQQYPDS